MHKELNYIFRIVKRIHNILLLFESVANMQGKNYWLRMNGFPHQCLRELQCIEPQYFLFHPRKIIKNSSKPSCFILPNVGIAELFIILPLSEKCWTSYCHSICNFAFFIKMFFSIFLIRIFKNSHSFLSFVWMLYAPEKNAVCFLV